MVRVFLVLLFWHTGFVGSVQQSPSNLFKSEKDTAELACEHKIASYTIILWYKQTQTNHGLTLLGYIWNKNYFPEDNFRQKIDLDGDGANKGSLKVKDLEAGDSAMYYCAASKISGGGGQAFFGNGTKLTVLERNLSIPNSVEILKPSGIETGCKKKVTLVCVVRNFYPDHVSIRWTLGGIEIKDDVATDPYAIQDKDTKLFSISSRLQVSKKQFKPKHNYTCTMRFYNETDKYQNISGSIIGIEGDEYEPENYVNSAQWMKLAYGVFIAKSGLYGLVVLVYVMRKGSSGK